MKNPQDYRDFAVLVLVTMGWVAATLFLFIHPSATNFATWAGFGATVGGVYHFLCVNDDKRVDAGNVAAVLPNMVEGAAAETRDWLNHTTYPGDKDAGAA